MKERRLSKDKKLDELEGYILILKSRPTINLKQLSRECNLEWSIVEAEIAKNGWFTQAIAEVLEDYKYTLIGKIETLALGEARVGPAPNLTAIRQMIQMIDRGEVLAMYGVSKEEEADGLTEEQRRRFGLEGEDDET